MKVEYVNPFISAGIQALSQLVGGEAECGQLAVRSAIFTTQQISIAIGVSGEITGQVIYGMSQVTATKVASALIGNQHMTFDEVAVSAISELGSTIAGHAAAYLAESGFRCELTPPTVIRGIHVELDRQGPALEVPLHTKCGKIDVIVAISQSEKSEPLQ